MCARLRRAAKCGLASTCRALKTTTAQKIGCCCPRCAAAWGSLGAAVVGRGGEGEWHGRTGGTRRRGGRRRPDLLLHLLLPPLLPAISAAPVAAAGAVVAAAAAWRLHMGWAGGARSAQAQLMAAPGAALLGEGKWVRDGGE